MHQRSASACFVIVQSPRVIASYGREGRIAFVSVYRQYLGKVSKSLVLTHILRTTQSGLIHRTPTFQHCAQVAQILLDVLLSSTDPFRDTAPFHSASRTRSDNFAEEETLRSYLAEPASARPVDQYARTTDWSEKASQGLCESGHSPLFLTDAWIIAVTCSRS